MLRGVSDLPSLIQLSDEVLPRYSHVLEEHLVEAFVARHLHQRPDGDPGRLHVDQNVGDAVVLRRAWVGTGEAKHPIGELRVRSPNLLAVDNEKVADQLRARLERRQIGAGSRLGVALTPDVLGIEDPGQERPLLRLGAVLHQSRADHLDAHHPDHARRPRLEHLFSDDRLAHERLPLVGVGIGAAAVLLWPVHGQVARFVELTLPGPQLGDALGVTKLRGHCLALAPWDVALKPPPDFAPKRDFVLVERKIHRLALVLDRIVRYRMPSVQFNLRRNALPITGSRRVIGAYATVVTGSGPGMAEILAATCARV
jgi:hypothetical protein